MILEILYFLLVPGIVNMGPVFFKKVPFLNYSLDFCFTFRGKRILGENKTFRGLFFGVLVGIILSFCMRYLYQFSFFQEISLVDYSSLNIIFYGVLIGFGVILGDALGSFLKRQCNVKPGESFFVVDQIDSVVVFPLVLSLLVWIGWSSYLWSIVLWGVFHVLLKYLGYVLKIEDKKI